MNPSFIQLMQKSRWQYMLRLSDYLQNIAHSISQKKLIVQIKETRADLINNRFRRKKLLAIPFRILTIKG